MAIPCPEAARIFSFYHFGAILMSMLLLRFMICAPCHAARAARLIQRRHSEMRRAIARAMPLFIYTRTFPYAPHRSLFKMLFRVRPPDYHIERCPTICSPVSVPPASLPPPRMLPRNGMLLRRYEPCREAAYLSEDAMPPPACPPRAYTAPESAI